MKKKTSRNEDTKKFEKKFGDAGSIYSLELMQKGSIFSEEAVKTVKLVQSLLYKVPKKIAAWFLIISAMFIITFGAGISVLLAAIVLAFTGSNELLSLVLASAGGATVITSFIAVPPLKLQQSRIDFTQWTIAFHAWLLVYFNTYEKTLPLFDEAGWADFKSYNNYLLEFTHTTLKMMEEMCGLPTQARSGKSEVQ